MSQSEFDQGVCSSSSVEKSVGKETVTREKDRGGERVPPAERILRNEYSAEDRRKYNS